MNGGRTRRRGMPAWLAVGLGVTGVTLVVAAVLAVTVLPPVLENVTSEVAAVDTVVPVSDGADASVEVPRGWVFQRPPFQSDAVLLRTPDGMLEVTLQLAADPAVRGDAAPAVSETLASGISIRHALDPSSQTLSAVVGAAAPDARGAPGASLQVTATVAPEAEFEDYTAAIALVLDGIRGLP